MSGVADLASQWRLRWDQGPSSSSDERSVARTYRASELTKRFGVARNTLFRWEAQGKISPVPRDWRNWRLYTDVHVREIEDIVGGQGRLEFPSD